MSGALVKAKDRSARRFVLAVLSLLAVATVSGTALAACPVTPGDAYVTFGSGTIVASPFNQNTTSYVITNPAGHSNLAFEATGTGNGFLTFINNGGMIDIVDSSISSLGVLTLTGTNVGEVCYDGSGAITNTHISSGTALVLSNTGPGTITASLRNDIAGRLDGVVATGDGDISIEMTAGTISALNGSGIRAESNSGDVAVTLAGGSIGTALTPTGAQGVTLLAPLGAVFLDVDNDVSVHSDNVAIVLNSNESDLTVLGHGAGTGLIESDSASGISAQVKVGAGNITLGTAANRIGNVAANHHGILAQVCNCFPGSTASGDISIYTAGTIDAGLQGILASNSGSGDIIIDTAGSISGDGAGIFAGHDGDTTGDITIRTASGTTITAVGGFGPGPILAFIPGPIGIGAERGPFAPAGATGNIVIDNHADVTADTVGIYAAMCGCTDGSVVINTDGDINAAVGVYALNGDGPVTINITGGTVTGTLGGIGVDSATTATVTIAKGANLSGTDGYLAFDPATRSVVTVGGTIDATQLAIQLGTRNDRVTLLDSYAISGIVDADLGIDRLDLGGADAGKFDLAQLGPQYRNFESLHKKGTSTWTVTGSSTFAGGTFIDGGKLVFNGSLANSTATVGVDGILGGNGTFGGLNVLGTVAPGNSIGTMNVAGNVTIAAGSHYDVEVNSAGQSDLIAATGTATISGGTVNALPEAGTYGGITKYTILTAGGGVTGIYAGATSASTFFTATLSYDPNTVYLTLTRNATTVASVGITPNQKATGKALDDLGIAAPYLADILALGGPDVPGMLDALSGEVHASIGGVFLEDSRFVRQAALDRVQQAFDALDAVAPNGYTAGPADGPANPEKDIWGRLYGGVGTIATDGNAAAVDHMTGGLIAGADGLLGDWRLGLLVNVGQTFASIPDRNSTANSTDAGLGVYGGTQFNDIGVKFGAAYTLHQVHTERSAIFPGVNDTFTADYAAGTGQVFAEVNKTFDLGGTELTPFLSAAYINQASAGFAETGGPGALTGAAGNFSALIATLGLHVSTQFVLQDDMLVTLTGTAGWRHAFADLPASSNAFLGGGPFVIAGAPIAPDALVIEAKADINLTSTTDLSFAYSGQIGGGVALHSGTATLSVKF